MTRHTKRNVKNWKARALAWLERANWRTDEADEERQFRALIATKATIHPSVSRGGDMKKDRR